MKSQIGVSKRLGFSEQFESFRALFRNIGLQTKKTKNRHEAHSSLMLEHPFVLVNATFISTYTTAMEMAGMVQARKCF